MARYRLSGKADSDIENIAETSIGQWGLARAETYLLGLHETFLQLAKFPEMGRDASHIRPGYLYIKTASHVVFYQQAGSGILIIRILHERMNFGRHL